ncbi:hypothetical protein LTS15_000420 [Exophiala xenobiotica]|nr:hypothetical protein LTS15_000420 [Exophiala xenobiotica]
MAAVSAEMYLQFLETGKFSDFIIECQGVEFKVHRIVEAVSGRIKFPEEEPETMARAILFMYSNDYDDTQLPKFYKGLINDDDADEEERLRSGPIKEIDELGLRRPLKVNTLVYKCADMLGLDGLMHMASARFMTDAKLAFEMDGFEDPLRLLYESTRSDDRNLRFEVTCLCVENHDLLEIRKKTFAVMREHEPNVWSVSVELLKRLATDSTSEKSSGKKMRLGKMVKLFNRRATSMDCDHMVYINTVRAAVVSPSSIGIKCPIYDPEDEG